MKSSNWLYLFVLTSILLTYCQADKQTVDILIVNGTILDGSGQDSYSADIGITSDTIAFIGNAIEIKLQAIETIDASGYIVAPGFIDPHTHTFSDLSHPERSASLNYLMQGVTTVITGNDGGGPVKIDSVLSSWEESGIGTNAALFVGHGTIRRLTMGRSDKKPDLEHLATMKRYVSNAMDEGALGLSTGLYYPPGSFSETEEIIELARESSVKGGIYDSHIRDESSYNIGLLGAIEEVINISRSANIPAHIAHIKALGVDVWGKSTEVIKLIEEARNEGLMITADQYPYPASGTSVTASLVPRWVFANDREFWRKFDDPALSSRIKNEMEENLRRRGGASSLLVTVSKDSSIVGKTLEEISQEWEVPVIDAAMLIIKNGGASVGSFNMNQDDIHEFMKQPWVMTGSDGSDGHPRKYGSFPKKIKEYVLEKEILTMTEFIRRSSSLTAETHKIAKRGSLKKGYFADIIVFKPGEIRDNATFKEPRKLAEGIHYVLVNGKIAIANGNYTDIKAGIPIRRGK